jgi:hypothetical protein
MLRGSSRRWPVAVLLTLLAACETPRDPIVINEGTLSVENQSRSEWRNVRVVVNDHFFGGAPVLAPGGRLTAPLSQFQTGFGQKFDRGRMSVQKVEVTATDAAGNEVKLEWVAGRRRFTD